MTLQETIQTDLKIAICSKNKEVSDLLKLIVAEFQRSKYKQLTDDETVVILRKLYYEEIDRIRMIVAKSKNPDLVIALNPALNVEIMTMADNSSMLKLVSNYIPKQVSIDDITDWIKNNIDFSKFRNKFQAVGKVLEHFGTRTDGNTVKNIVSTME